MAQIRNSFSSNEVDVMMTSEDSAKMGKSQVGVKDGVDLSSMARETLNKQLSKDTLLALMDSKKYSRSQINSFDAMKNKEGGKMYSLSVEDMQSNTFLKQETLVAEGIGECTKKRSL